MYFYILIKRNTIRGLRPLCLALPSKVDNSFKGSDPTSSPNVKEGFKGNLGSLY